VKPRCLEDTGAVIHFYSAPGPGDRDRSGAGVQLYRSEAREQGVGIQNRGQAAQLPFPGSCSQAFAPMPKCELNEAGFA
jgi:hypothetical protein